MGCGGSRAPPAHESRGELTAVPAGHGPTGGPSCSLLFVALSTVAPRRPRPRPHPIRPRRLQPRRCHPARRRHLPRRGPSLRRPGRASVRVAQLLALPPRSCSIDYLEFNYRVPLHCGVPACTAAGYPWASLGWRAGGSRVSARTSPLLSRGEAKTKNV